MLDSVSLSGESSIYGSTSFIIFFFKQKTAYEMRISDWSSDVCSSDLNAVGAQYALRDVGNMHRAALAVANAGLFAHELRRHSARISALRQEVTVPAMSAGNPVAVVKMCADAGGHRFLANI